MSSSEASVKKSCCNWPRVIFTFVLIAVAVVLIRLFVPFDQAITNVLPNFAANSTDSTDMPAPSSSPSTQPYVFIQCQTKDDCCQGLDGMCDLRLGEVLFAGAHNSFASTDKGFFIEANQKIETKVSLAAGFRDISVDMCNCDGRYVLCHGICKLAERSAVEFFTEIVTFLNDNPSEIIVINIEINSQAGQQVTLDGIYQVLTNVSGMTDMLYQHSNSSYAWPTLRTLRDADTRIILFHYNGANCDAGDCPVGMNFYWDYAVETEYSFIDLQELENITYSCKITRGVDRSSKKFFAVNGFVTPTSELTAATANLENFANSRIENCSHANENLTVSTYYVDFWSVGDLPRLVQERNTALVAQHKTKQ